ncbi:MAG: hypothetical protein Q4D98_05675 [Planctomycetia bacterium]|nr:hypothetical protein [Planctomycetia bacterium]
MLGHTITQEEFKRLAEGEVDEIQQAALKIRHAFTGNRLYFYGFIIFQPGQKIDTRLILKEAIGASLRTGHCFDIDLRHNPLSDALRKELMETCREIHERTQMNLVLSHVDLTCEEFLEFQKCGVYAYHEMLAMPRKRLEALPESQRPSRTYDEKLALLKKAHSTGLKISTGGFFDASIPIDEIWEFFADVRKLDLHSFILSEPEWVNEQSDWQNNYTRIHLMRNISLIRFLIPRTVIVLGNVDKYLPDPGKWILNSSANGTRNLCAEAFGISLDDDSDKPHNMGFVIF